MRDQAVWGSSATPSGCYAVVNESLASLHRSSLPSHEGLTDGRPLGALCLFFSCAPRGQVAFNPLHGAHGPEFPSHVYRKERAGGTDAGALWAALCAGGGTSATEHFLFSNDDIEGMERGHRSGEGGWWLNPDRWTLVSVTAARLNVRGVDAASVSSSADGAFVYMAPFYRATVEVLPLTPAFSLSGSALNDGHRGLFDPYALLRAPLDKPTPRVAARKHGLGAAAASASAVGSGAAPASPGLTGHGGSEQAPPPLLLGGAGCASAMDVREGRNRELFAPLSEMAYMELFRRLVESTPYMQREEAQGCGFDVPALHLDTNRDDLQVRAFYFLHKRNAARKNLAACLGFDDSGGGGGSKGSGSSGFGGWSLGSLFLTVDEQVAEDIKNYFG